MEVVRFPWGAARLADPTGEIAAPVAPRPWWDVCLPVSTHLSVTPFSRAAIILMVIILIASSPGLVVRGIVGGGIEGARRVLFGVDFVDFYDRDGVGFPAAGGPREGAE
jgi:hypothetical protein